ncbi:MAG: 4-hydroxybenzoate octaprenyltransferase [candidate division FCPU426 bacterium]
MITLKKIGSFVKVEHTLFSLPLLFAGALLAPRVPGTSFVPWDKFLWIVLAGVGARTAALALNRLIDARIDAKNPRTQSRELPSGALSRSQGWAISAVGAVLYLFAAAQLGPLCLKLSPLPLAVFALYPMLKRVTWAAHFGVGLGLALAPLGGFIGMTDAWPVEPGPWWLAGFAFCWVSGFDILYACLDEAFDRKEGLHSIPSKFGRPVAQDVALILHALALFCLVAMRWAAFSPKPTWIWTALAPVALLLTLEQKYGYSLEKDSPFFRVNAWIGAAAFVYVLVGVW